MVKIMSEVKREQSTAPSMDEQQTGGETEGCSIKDGDDFATIQQLRGCITRLEAAVDKYEKFEEEMERDYDIMEYRYESSSESLKKLQVDRLQEKNYAELMHQVKIQALQANIQKLRDELREQKCQTSVRSDKIKGCYFEAITLAQGIKVCDVELEGILAETAESDRVLEDLKSQEVLLNRARSNLDRKIDMATDDIKLLQGDIRVHGIPKESVIQRLEAMQKKLI